MLAKEGGDMKNKYQYLSGKTLGKTGRDYFSKDKDLTIVMFPYESHSAFPKAIQEIHKVLSIPFNLIIVEGNASDEVRSQLEDCERRYDNTTVLYSTKYLSPGEIINLAKAQIKTPYSFFLDNEIYIRPGCIERMLANAKNWGTDIVFPKNSLVSRVCKTPQKDIVSLETPGLRLAFLISTSSLSKLVKVDEHTDLYTAGWDLMLEFQAKGLRTRVSDEAWVESYPEHAIRRSDRSLYQHQWDLKRHHNVIGYFQSKWNLEIQDGLYQRWFEAKSHKVAAPASENTEYESFAHEAKLQSRPLESPPASLENASLPGDNGRKEG